MSIKQSVLVLCNQFYASEGEFGVGGFGEGVPSALGNVKVPSKGICLSLSWTDVWELVRWTE